jgi:PIN domain nuclease of toxin-antitoxin system
MTAPLLDTHAWLWWMDRSERLGPHTLSALDALDAENRPYLSDISLWEVAMLVDLGRIELRLPLQLWLDTAAHPRSVRVVPITPAIAAATAGLPATFHRDPADRLIVGTCRAMGLPIVTHDQRITRARLVKRWVPERDRDA